MIVYLSRLDGQARIKSCDGILSLSVWHSGDNRVCGLIRRCGSILTVGICAIIYAPAKKY